MHASVTTSPPPLIPSTSIKEFKYEPTEQERDDEDDEEDNCNDDNDNFVQDEARKYGKENVGPVPSST